MTELFYAEGFFPWLGFLIGSCLGSFLNVVAYRVPRELSVIRPGSSCPHCSTPIPWTWNIPVLGWLVLGGKARCCGKRISPRYFLIELLVGLVFSGIFLAFPSQQDWGMLLASLAFAWLLIGVVVIDFETMLIPDRFSIGGACVGFFLSLSFPSIHGFIYHPMGLESLQAGLHSLLGILVGSGCLYWIGALAGRLFGREALGEGDVKLLGCVGAFCGWKGALFAIFGGALTGCIFLIPVYLWQKLRSSSQDDDHSLSFGQEIPFGPYLALAALGYFFWLREWIDPWFKWIDELVF
ncbi:MAG: prepilin peptidase [Opitutae bacterium]